MKEARIGTRTRVHLLSTDPRAAERNERTALFVFPPATPAFFISPLAAIVAGARVPVPRVVADLDPGLLFRGTCARSVPRSVPAPRLPAVPPLQVLHRPR